MSRKTTPALLSIGLDHHVAEVEVRERFSYGEREAEDLSVRLSAEPSIRELLLLSTCNRTELYLRPAKTDDPTAPESDEAFEVAFEQAFRARAPELAEHGGFTVRRGDEAARHLISVAAGLRSMVLGEPEILGQVRAAAESAERWGVSGPVLRRLARHAIAAGGRARSETGISAGAVSLGYATTELARQIFQNPADSRAVILGAGQTGLMVARALHERGFEKLAIVNRSRGRLERFLEEMPDAEPAPLEGLSDLMRRASLLVTAVSVSEPLVTRSEVEAAMTKRRGQPLLIVDLGVPRNVVGEAGEVENVFLHDIGALEALVERNLKKRRAEVPRVEEIVDGEFDRFLAWYRGLAAEPVVSRLQKRAELLRADIVREALPRFPRESHEELEKLTRALTRRLLHHPSRRLRDGESEDEIADLDLVRSLFRLDEDSDDD